MIEETGKVLAVEEGALWVEALQTSACGKCAAEKGCGQSLLSKLASNTVAIRALLQEGDESRFVVDDNVLIGIPENVVVSSTVLLYLLPLITMIVGVTVGHQWSGSDGASALGGLLGLIIGGLLVRFHSYRHRRNTDVQPVVLRRLT